MSKFISSRSQLIANIPQDQFEERIEYTKKLNRGRDLAAEMFSYAKYLKRERDRQKQKSEQEKIAADSKPDDNIKIL